MQVRLLSVIPALIVLCACGGAGDSGSSGQSVAFTSFSSVQPGQKVAAVGQSQTQNVTQDSFGTVTAQVMNLSDQNGVSAVWTYGPASPLVLTGIQFVVPRSGAGVAWSSGRVSQMVTCGNQLCSASGGGAAGVLANALGSLGWNFQTFGYWLADTSFPSNIAASISAGNATPVGGIPVSGSITYNGISGGLYVVDPAGALQEHAAVMSAIVDFAAGTINFSTTGTTLRPWNTTAVPGPASQLDIAGVVTYTAGTNRFTGTVTGPGVTPTISGTVTGVFYGPGAEEIGGTFELINIISSTSLESITGGFGGKH
jgi:hypothetical protein